MSSAKDRLAALADAFEQKTNTNNTNSSPVWKKFYPFWKMDEESQAVVRFLPNKDEDFDPMKFLVLNLTHELYVNGKKKKVPCLTMYGETCPCCELSSKYYAEGNEDMGKKYYKKRSYIGQVLVLESPFDYIDENDEENNSIIRLIDFGPKIFKCMQTAFKSGDLEDEPYQYKGGYNFRIKKTKAGKWSDYGTSSFSPKATDLDEEIIEQVKSELYNLADFREKHIERAQMEALLLADQTGRAMDDSSSDDSSDNVPVPANAAESAMNQSSEAGDSTPQETPKSSEKAKSVLEQLKARQAAASSSEASSA